MGRLATSQRKCETDEMIGECGLQTSLMQFRFRTLAGLSLERSEDQWEKSSPSCTTGVILRFASGRIEGPRQTDIPGHQYLYLHGIQQYRKQGDSRQRQHEYNRLEPTEEHQNRR